MLALQNVLTDLASVTLGVPVFDEEKLLIYRELYYDGFSSIIAARDLTSGAAVAVKKVEYAFMKPAPFPIRCLQRSFSRKVRQQVAKVRALSHNSVLKIIEFVVEPERIVIVTEMCMFGDLFNWMLQQAQLRVRDICLIIQYVQKVLSYLHSQNLIHGNLTPTHILFQAMSPQSVTVMPDLSIRNELVSLTAKAPPVFDCWAPEKMKDFLSLVAERKCLGKKTVEVAEDQPMHPYFEPTKSMDIWSVGCITHIALTGKPPFVANSVADMVNVIEGSEEKLKSPMLNRLSPLVEKQLNDTLAINPDDRPTAENSSDSHWFDDDITRADSRNILLTIEYDLLYTCRRYRTQGRRIFESVFSENSTVNDTTATDLVRD
ncbi:calcium/calmodulin-dependent protein kinase I [Paragonimus westermani]|uniref:Calcium/calmodulin-dependent protein kinase I n=1 Tax=Paragonimus westermani TaxID=34504 RepID=A0A5J4NR22_9TREM|nr:calcium/calmodulin-dependent protein kinase I [Paragonimus westermani]